MSETSTLQAHPDVLRMSRDDFMRGPGFLLYTDFSANMIEALKDMPVRKIEESPYTLRDRLEKIEKRGEKGINQANVGLYGVIEGLAQTPNSLSLERLGISGPDQALTNRKEIFGGGFGDREFVWHFAGAMAAAAVNRFVEEKKISKRDAAELTLGDWADVIGSVWFSKLIHQLAFTRNGIYRRFGQNINDYRRKSFEDQLKTEGGIDLPKGKKSHLMVRERPELLEGFMYLTAELDPQTRENMRTLMRQSKMSSIGRSSTGCPVARRSTRMQEDYLLSDPHAAALIKRGILSVRSRSSGTVHAEQEATAIDRVLEFIAWQIDEYERLYGTPRIALGTEGDDTAERAQAQLTHEHRSRTNVLKRPWPRLLWRY